MAPAQEQEWREPGGMIESSERGVCQSAIALEKV